MEGENQPPPAEMDGETQPPPAETEVATQQPAYEIEGEPQPTPLPACVSKVLDDDDLLTEIIARVGFPTSLVRAAAVCRRWLRLASDRAFLRRFRKLHSPGLLGFYLAENWRTDDAASFFPMMLPGPSLPAELAGVVHRATFSLDFYEGKPTSMVGCWNGRVVTSLHVWDITGRHELTFVVHSPLRSERGVAVMPALHLPFKERNICTCRQLFSKEEDGVVSYFYVMVESTMEGKSVVQVFMLRNGDDTWHTHLTLTVDYLIHARSAPEAVLVDNKVYMATDQNEMVVLDLMASSFSTVQLPQGVDCRATGATMLSPADDASAPAVYLIHAKDFQLHIWLCKGGNWLLMDKICFREMCAHLLEDEPPALLQINHVGDYTGEFLFLEIGRCAYFLDVKCRTLRKVYEMTEDYQYLSSIYPFMMIWPPVFPVLKDGSASNAT